MVINTVSSLDTDPTPEFNARGLAVLHQWETSAMPFDEAIVRFTQLAHEAIQSKHLANQGRAEHFLGYLQHYRGNLNTSIMHYDRARSLFMQVGNENRIAIIDLNQGENYRNKGEFSRARRLYRSAHDAAARLGNLRIQTMAIANEGLTLLSLKDYGAARQALDEGLRLSNQWVAGEEDFYELRCEIYHGLATLDLIGENIAEAWQHAQDCLDSASQEKQPLSLGYAYRIMGEVLTVIPNPAELGVENTPDDYYRAALEAFRNINAEGEMGRTVYCQAKSLAQRGKRRSAAQMFKEAMVIFELLGMTDDAAKAAEAQLLVLK